MADMMVYVLIEVVVKNEKVHYAVIGVYGSKRQVEIYCQEMNSFKRMDHGNLVHYFYTEHSLE